MARSDLSLSDEGLLRWYFGDGQCAFEGSSFGAMLERGQMYGFAKEELDDTPERILKKHVPDPRKRKAVHASEPWDPNPITARPTAEVREPGGYVPKLSDMSRYASANRKLRKLAGRKVGIGVPAASVFELYEGPLGERYGVQPGGGRSRSLCHLTEAGAEIVRRALERAHGGRSRLVTDLGLTEQQATFVYALNFEPDGVPDRFAAIRAGYAEASAEETAKRLRRLTKVQNAIGLRRSAELTLDLQAHEVYSNEVHTRTVEGRQDRRSTRMLGHTAEDQARQLYAQACREWNSVR